MGGLKSREEKGRTGGHEKEVRKGKRHTQK